MFLAVVHSTEGPLAANDYFVLTARFLNLEFKAPPTGDQLDSLFVTLHDIAPRNMTDVSRSGGSNGNWHTLSPQMFKGFLRTTGAAPRISRGCKWILQEDRLVVIYVSPYNDHQKTCIFKYRIPFKSSQIVWTGPKFEQLLSGTHGRYELLRPFILSKVLAAKVFRYTNEAIASGGWKLLASSSSSSSPLHKNVEEWLNSRDGTLVAHESTLAEIKRIQKQEGACEGSERTLLLSLLRNCTTTVMGDAIAMHRDVSRSGKTPSGKKKKGRQPFIENKILFQVPCLSSYDRKSLPLGRGGAGSGVFVFAST